MMGHYYNLHLVKGDVFSRSFQESEIAQDLEGFKPGMPLDKIFKTLEKNQIDLNEILEMVDGIRDISIHLNEMKSFAIDSDFIDLYFSKEGLKLWYGVDESGYFIGSEVHALLKEWEMAYSKLRLVDTGTLSKMDADEYEWLLEILQGTITEFKYYMGKGYKDAILFLPG